MHEAWHVKMRHHTWEWVLSHENKSCHVKKESNRASTTCLMANLWVGCDMARINESWHIRMSHEGRIWTQHSACESVVARVNASCRMWMGREERQRVIRCHIFADGTNLCRYGTLWLVWLVPAQEWSNRTLISHEPLICSKMCFAKSESVQE